MKENCDARQDHHICLAVACCGFEGLYVEKHESSMMTKSHGRPTLRLWSEKGR